MVFVAVIAVVVVLIVVWSRVRARRRLAFIEGYAFPAPLQSKLREHHPQLTHLQADLAIEALREWFAACHHAKGRMIAMPSRVADDAWHEFILMTRLYHAFCNEAFGRYLHHSPDAVSEKPIRPSIPKTLEVLEANGKSVAALGALPLLFVVDDELGVENGSSWTRELVERQANNDSAAGCLGGGSHVSSQNGGCGGCGSCGGCGGCGSCG
jgi:hypothetical protein